MEATSRAVSIPVPEPDLLTQVLRQGAQRMLAQAIEVEAVEWTERHSHVRDEQGHRQVVRNGYLPERKLVTGLGEIPGSTASCRSPAGRAARTLSPRRFCRRICESPRALTS